MSSHIKPDPAQKLPKLAFEVGLPPWLFFPLRKIYRRLNGKHLLRIEGRAANRRERSVLERLKNNFTDFSDIGNSTPFFIFA